MTTLKKKYILKRHSIPKLIIIFTIHLAWCPLLSFLLRFLFLQFISKSTMFYNVHTFLY